MFRQQVNDNGVVEVRREADPWSTGYFDDPEAIAALPDLYPNDNLYMSVNRIGNKLATNKIDGRDFLTDGDISRITRLFFDFDPVRPSDTSSTDIQLKAAKQRAAHFVQFMSDRGFPEPAKALSGNGCHLLYNCDLDLEFHPYIKRLYQALERQFSDDLVSFDRSVSSLGQITRLYGSVNHKGVATADQPHRRSIIWTPDSYEKVTAETLWDLIKELGADKKPKRTAPTYSPQAIGKGDYKTLDIVGWFKSAGLYKKFISGNKYAVTCPWSENHSTKPNFSETVVFENPGYPGFYCSHNSCQGNGLFQVIAAIGNADDFCSKAFR